MKKNYSVSVDITMSVTLDVLAESEEKAMEIADNMVSKNPYLYKPSHYVSHEVICADEC